MSAVEPGASTNNADWKAGEKQPHPYGDAPHVAIDPSKESGVYSLLISGVTPRPVAFVSSMSKKGERNLAPFSYFSAVCHDPPLVSIGICNKGGAVKKDTLVNIEETGEFVVNIISEWMAESSSYTSGEFDSSVDEFEVSGLTPQPSLLIAPPRVKESAFQMECKVHSTQEIFNDKGVHTATQVLGRIVMFHAIEPCHKKNARGSSLMAYEGYKPLGRLGGDTWVKLAETFDIKRPQI